MSGAGVRDLLIDGPWRHRDVSANGIRFHLASGVRDMSPTADPSRPLVLLLHGFGQFWWAWRHQIEPLDHAGYPVAALDLRGYGASDKTPRGYDPRTTAADISGVVRALGRRQAILVGHDWGGTAAWSTAAYAPEQVRGLVSIGAPHPLHVPWWRGLGGLAFRQLPLLPERRLQDPDSTYLEDLLRSRAGPGSDFPTVEAARRYRDALMAWPSPHCALEYQRTFVRQSFGSSGRHYRRALQTSVHAPLLSIHGAADPVVPQRSMAAAARHVTGPHTMVDLPDVGHHAHEEAPEEVTAALLDWLAAAL